MGGSAGDADLIQRRWRSMSGVDREAVLAHFESEERAQLQDRLAELEGDGHAYRYRGYTPWFGRLIEACETSSSADAQRLKLATREALLAAHETALGRPATARPGLSLLDLAQTWLQRWTKRL